MKFNLLLVINEKENQSNKGTGKTCLLPLLIEMEFLVLKKRKINLNLKLSYFYFCEIFIINY